MDIENFIYKEAPDDSPHDKAYATALRKKYKLYNPMQLTELQECQKIARDNYDSAHNSVASCMILYQLINEHAPKK